MVDFTALDAVFTKLDPATKKFVNETSYYVGTVQDLNPGAYPALRSQFNEVMTALTTWRRAYIVTKEGGASGANPVFVDTLISNGNKLYNALGQINQAAKSSRPSDFSYYVKGTAVIAAQVTGEIAQGAAKIGQDVMKAGSFLTGNLVPVVLAGLFAWFVLPKLLATYVTSKGAK